MRRFGVLFCIAVLGFAGAAGAARADVKITVNPDPARFDTDFLSDPDGAMKAARELVAAGDLAGAIKKLGTYVAAHGKEAGPARLLGDLYYRQGELGKAEDVYRAILAQYPNSDLTATARKLEERLRNRPNTTVAIAAPVSVPSPTRR